MNATPMAVPSFIAAARYEGPAVAPPPPQPDTRLAVIENRLRAIFESTNDAGIRVRNAADALIGSEPPVPMTEGKSLGAPQAQAAVVRLEVLTEDIGRALNRLFNQIERIEKV